MKEIQINKLSKHFKTANGEKLQVLDKIDASVYQNQLFVILGSSGCGKSTLLKIIAGLEKDYEGSISIDGKPLTNFQSKIGMVFQKYTLFPWLTVYRNISFGLRLKKLSKEQIHEKVVSYLKITGLEGFEDYYPYQISEGMKQRVAIARALVLDPEILLMDEPFGALDVKTNWEMQNLVRDISAKTNSTILFVTHNVEEGIFLGDRICILSPRPARVVKIIDSPFPKNRDETIKNSKEFLNIETETNQILREAIH